MTQTSSRFFDEMSRLMGDAASVAEGVRREAETAFRSQIERFVADMDLVRREEFDIVRDMASQARVENAALLKRIAELEKRLGITPAAAPVAESAPPPEPPQSVGDEPRAEGDGASGRGAAGGIDDAGAPPADADGERKTPGDDPV